MENKMDDAIDVGAWMGRPRPFGRAGMRYSAADAECLSMLKSKKLYRTCRRTWKQFCEQCLGFDYSTADEIIRNLDEFGPVYFHLASVVPIGADRFRRIAAAVSELGVTWNGELLPFHVAPPGKLAKAVRSLSARAVAEAQQAHGVDQVGRAEISLKNTLAELESVSTLPMDSEQRQSLRLAFEQAVDKLGRLSCGVLD